MHTVKSTSLMIYIAIAILLLGMWPTLLSIHPRWYSLSDSYAHGYPLLFYALYLLWENIKTTRSFEGGASISGLIFLVIPTFSMWLLATFLGLESVAQFFLPFLLGFSLLSIFGIRSISIFAAPIFILFIAMPFWGLLNTPLRHLATIVTYHTVDAVGINVTLEELQLKIPSGYIQITKGCSGQNYLISSILIASIYAINFIRSKVAALVIITSIAATALLANWIRVISLSLIGHYTELQHPLMQDHVFFGWVIYAGAMLVYYFFFKSYILKWSTDIQNDRTIKDNQQFFNFTQPYLSVFLTLSIATALFSASHWSRERTYNEDFELQLNSRILAIEADALTFSASYSGYDRRKMWRGLIEGKVIDIEALIYDVEKPEKEMVFFENTVVGVHNGYGIYERKVFPNFVLIKYKDQHQHVAIYWSYLVAEQVTPSATKTKLLQALSSVQQKPSPAFIAVSLQCDNTCPSIDPANINELFSSFSWERQI